MQDPYEVVVVGGGIAGLTAGLTSARLGRSTMVLSGEVLGGHLVSIEAIEGVPGFPEGVPGFDYMPLTEEQAAATGAEIRSAEATLLKQSEHLWDVVTHGVEVPASAVILATGTRMKSLGVPGEEAFFGKGVSQCASCDAPLLRDEVALVVGGGDSAMQEALTLATALRSVTILVRGDSLAGQASFQKRVNEHPKIDIRYGTAVDEITGDSSVTGALVRNLDTDDVEELPATAVFPFVGLEPASGLVADLVQLDSVGGVITDAEMRTSRPGLLAAGTVRSGSAARATRAGGEGASAALAADAYLRSGEWANEIALVG